MRSFILVTLILVFANCAAKPDYSLFERHRPRNILVIAPLNNTASVDAPDKYLATVTEPVAERGYYVFPVAIVDRMLKENGVITAAEMRQVPRDKLREIFGADALLDITIEEWGTKYFVVASSTTVTLNYRLLDLHTGQELWSTKKTITDRPNNSGGGLAGILIGSLAHAVSSTASDAEVPLAYQLNSTTLPKDDVGLLKGPRWVEPDLRR